MRTIACCILITFIASVAFSESFTERLFSPDPGVSLQALNEITDLTNESKQQLNEMLLPMFNSKSKTYRRIAVSAAANTKVYSKAAVSAFLAVLKTDTDSLSRLNAAQALSYRKLKDNEEVLSALLSAMTDNKEDKGVRQTAARSLLLLEAKKAEVISFYREALLDENAVIRAWTVTAAAEKNEVRDVLATELLKSLSDKDRIVRCNAVNAVLKLKVTAEVESALKIAAKDPDREVRETAEKALKNLKGTK